MFDGGAKAGDPGFDLDVYGQGRRGVDNKCTSTADDEKLREDEGDDRSEQGKDDGGGRMGQMAVESVGSEACIERCWIVTPQNGVLVIDKGWTREKECRRQQATRRR